MTENRIKEIVGAMTRVTVLSGIYIGKKGEDPAIATFRAKYTYIQKVSEEEAEEMYQLAISEGISPDSIIQISCMEYTHEQIQNILKGDEALHVIKLIIDLRIYPRK